VTRLDRSAESQGNAGAGDAGAGSGVADLLRTMAAIPAVWRGLGAGLGLIAVLASSSGVAGLFDEILGLTLAVTAGLEQLPRFFGGTPTPWWRSAAIASAGVLIVVWPTETAESLGAITALVTAAYGMSKIVKAIRTPPGPRRLDRLARGLLVIVLAVVVAVFPEATLRIVVLFIGAAWFLEAVTIGAAVGRSQRDAVASGGRMPSTDDLTQWVDQRSMDPVERDRVDSVLTLDGVDSRRRLFRFGVLMSLSAALATLGIASDSTAAVIGAMLIAPLMGPILAAAGSLLRNRPRKALRSLATAAIAACGAVLLAWVLGAFIPNLQSVMANGEVTSRTAPNLVDLAIALTAGAAGTFAVCRADVSEALPGVAVAIALVPPLAVSGLALRAGEVDDALGALLLFTTNLFAILAMAGIVFVLSGYVSWAELRQHGRHVRASYATVAAGVVLLLIPLGLTARTVIREAEMERSSQVVVEAWLGDSSDLVLDGIDVTGDRVEVVLRGLGITPSPDRLHGLLSDELGTSVVLYLRVVPEETHVVSS
jgi:uncharacterized hydrophobic protein (TIGR00271 family)